MKATTALCASVLAVVVATLAGCGDQTSTQAPATSGESIPALEWIPIAQTSDGGAILYDPAQTKSGPAGNFTDVVIRVRHPYLEGWAQDLPKGYSGEVVFQTEQATLRFDCASRTMGVVSREALGADGAVLDKRVTPEPVMLAPVSAGGVGEAVLPKACASVAPPAP